MVQKSCDHQLRLVVEIPLFTGFFYIQTVVGLGISEPSTVSGDLPGWERQVTCTFFSAFEN